MADKSLSDPRNVRDGTSTDDAELTRRITEAVRAATEPLQARIDHLARNRDSILREKRELEGRAIKAAEERVNDRPRAIDFAITRTRAKDPAEYRRAKAEAAKHGFELLMLDDTKGEQMNAVPPDTYQSDTHYYVFGPSIKADHGAYMRHKAEAERLGLRFHVAYSAKEMPKAAFGGGDQ